MAGRLIRLLEVAAAEPERAIGTLDILSAEERHTCTNGSTPHVRSPLPRF
jgi:hypothetical protein